jgi:hypothetical protein
MLGTASGLPLLRIQVSGMQLDREAGIETG